MPQVENLSKLLNRKTELTAPIPPNYEWRAGFHELSVRFSTIPLSWRLNTLFQTINADIDQPITVDEIIQASRPYEPSQMRWQSIRLDEETPVGKLPTGWEHLHMGKGLNNEDITAHIALLGLQLQTNHAEVINQLLTGGFPSFSLSQLQEANQIIEATLAQEKQGMNKQAIEFREETMRQIQELPPDLTQSYYYRGGRGQIITVATVLQRLPPHTSFTRPIMWQTVYERALRQKRSKDLTIQDLQRGRQIVELLSHGTGSFTRGLFDCMNSKKR